MISRQLRDHLRNVLGGMVDFARILTTTVSTERNTIRGGIEEIDTEIPDQEIWGNAALLVRFPDPDADGRAAECMYFRMEDELVAFAHRDTRNQPALAQGESVLRALGPGNVARVWVKPDGTLQIDTTGTLTINKDAGVNTFTIKLNASSELELGSSGLDYVALAAKVDSFITKIDTLIRTTWTPVSNDGGAALKTAYTTTTYPTPPASVAATKVKAE